MKRNIYGERNMLQYVLLSMVATVSLQHVLSMLECFYRIFDNIFILHATTAFWKRIHRLLIRSTGLKRIKSK